VHAFRLTLQFSFSFEFQYKSERSHGICLLHLQDLYFTIMQYRWYQKRRCPYGTSSSLKFLIYELRLSDKLLPFEITIFFPRSFLGPQIFYRP
jgi:hypothetical protein